MMNKEQGILTRQIILFLFSALCCLGCTKSTTEVPESDFGYEYFPLDIGKELIYELDSIIYDPDVLGTRVDTLRTFVKEEIVDSLRDNQGNLFYKVERFERKTIDQPWVIRHIWTSHRDEFRAFRTEDNLRFIKMVFPLRERESWNGNAFFDESLIVPVAGESIELFKGWEYRVAEVDAPLQLGDLSFPEVATIFNADSENLIEYRFVTEKYAKGVGLVYREMRILDTQCQVCCNGDFAQCENLPWQAKAEKGFILIQRLIDHN